MFWQLNLRNKTGAQAEARALQFLKQQQLKLVSKNYACRHGELDLIMLDKNTLVFIEVRSRSSNRYGGAAGSITRTKQQKMTKAASHFLQQHRDHQHRHCRFDAILIKHQTNTVTCNNDEPPPKPIEWLQGIF